MALLRASELKPSLEFDLKTAPKVPKKFLKNKRAIVKNKDVLIAVKGATIASEKSVVYVETAPKDCIVNGSIFRFQCNEDALPKYVAYILDLPLLKEQMNHSLVANNAVNYLDKATLGSLKIPLPPLETQQQIIDIMDAAYRVKKQKETEAQRLLDSIDDYVLSELRIELPEFEHKMCFSVWAGEVEGRRLDAYYSQPKFRLKNQHVETSKYKCIQLGDLVTNLTNGKEFRNYSNSGHRYLRVSDLDRFHVNEQNIRYIDIKEIPQSIRLDKSKDILISRSGSLGLISKVLPKLENAVLSSHIFRVTINTDRVALDYLVTILRSFIGQFQFFHKNNGGVIPEINQAALKSIKVILPPFDIQQKIATEVQARVDKSEALKKQAQETLETAKAQVEKIILGDADAPIL